MTYFTKKVEFIEINDHNKYDWEDLYFYFDKHNEYEKTVHWAMGGGRFCEEEMDDIIPSYFTGQHIKSINWVMDNYPIYIRKIEYIPITDTDIILELKDFYIDYDDNYESDYKYDSDDKSYYDEVNDNNIIINGTEKTVGLYIKKNGKYQRVESSFYDEKRQKWLIHFTKNVNVMSKGKFHGCNIIELIPQKMTVRVKRDIDGKEVEVSTCKVTNNINSKLTRKERRKLNKQFVERSCVIRHCS